MGPGQVVDNAALFVIAERLRTAREQAGYTLDELASFTGLSKAHLSRLESGERQPSIAALLTVAGAVRVPVGWLLGEQQDQPALPLHVYAPTQPSHEVAGLRVVPSSGYPGSGALEALRMTISSDREPGVPARHRGEEWIYVVDGGLRLEYDGRSIVVAPGSCAHFDAERPHRLAAEGMTAEVLVVTAQGNRGFWSAHR